MSGLPELPAFLTNELRCPLDRCHKPSAFATPIPADLSPALAEFVLRCTESSLWSSSVAYTTGDRRINAAVEDFIIESALRHKSRHAFVRAMARGGDEMAALEAKIIATTITLDRSPQQSSLFALAVSHYLDTGFMVSLSAILRTPGESVCLHKVIDVDAGVDWRRAGMLGHLLRDPSSPNSVRSQMLPQSLLRHFELAIARGALRGAGWEPRSDWKPEVKKVFEESMTMASGVVYKGVVGSGGSFDGYRDIVKSPGFVLRLITQEHKPNRPPSFTNGLPHFDTSLKAQQLVMLSQAPRDQRRSILNLIPPPSKSLPANIVQSPTPPANSSSPPSPFQRLEITPTYSERLPFVSIFPLPQCCPPDRCPSIESPVVENLKMVDAHLGSIFRNLFAIEMTGRVVSNMELIRDDFLATAASQVTSLAISNSNDALSQTAFSAPSSAVFAMMGVEGEDLFRTVIGRFKESISGVFAPNFCRCRLSRRCEILESMAQTTGAHFEKTARIWFDQLKITPLDVRSAVERAEGSVRSGRLLSECWTGDWKEPFRGWIARAAEQIEEKLRDREGLAEYCASFDDCWRIIGSAGLLESVSGRLDQSTIALFQFFLRNDTDFAAFLADRKGLRQKADLDARSDRTASALLLYDALLLSNASDFQASLNSAAVRLQLANDSDQSFQWSRAISDCTFALYYGGPSFKAYYRRGFALAHLKMYKKAIADFDQALLIEPGNLVVETQLALAKKKV